MSKNNDETIVYCSNCGQRIDLEDGNYEEVDGNIYCLDCYTLCDKCGDVIIDNDYVIYDDEIYCKSCADTYLIVCDACGEYTRGGDLIYIYDINAHVCSDCVESENYFYCVNCATYYSEDSYGCDGMCTSCYNEAHENDEDEDCDGSLNSYSYKPSPNFYRSVDDPSNLYFGWENELEYSSNRDALDILEDSPLDRVLYYKRDSTIDHGFETVSHPGTLLFWQQQEENLKKAFHQLRGEANATTHEGVGLHVHVSRKGMSAIHKIRLFAFINSNPGQIEILAGRPATSWAKMKKISKGNLRADLCDPDRYQALNWLNSSTVEYRFFKAVTTADRLLSAIEFCHASYIFTKSQISIATILHQSNQSWSLFVDFVSANVKKYPHLLPWIS